MGTIRMGTKKFSPPSQRGKKNSRTGHRGALADLIRTMEPGQWANVRGYSKISVYGMAARASRTDVGFEVESLKSGNSFRLFCVKK